ncbi:MAG: hypothetical protein MJE66_01170 [Proteobacteria bacterium]|nr:hypothetical protein [Pseudomonadota bacterium]
MWWTRRWGTVLGTGEDRAIDAGLRERAATALEGAYEFTESHADEALRLRLGVLMGVRPLEDWQAHLETLEQEPGQLSAFEPAFEAWPAELAGVGQALGSLDDLRGLFAPLVGRVVSGLAEAQQGDGSWGRDPELPPTHRRFATGMLGGYLAKTRSVRPETLHAAGDFLAEGWSPDHVADGDWPAIAAHAHFFANTRHEASDEILQWCGRELERGFRARRFEARQVARVLLYCDAIALPGTQLTRVELLEALLGEQGRDGGFAILEMGGPARRAAPTFDAMLALVRLCSR